MENKRDESQKSQEEQPYQIFSRSIGREYDIYISDDIQDPHKCVTLVNLLRSLGPNDRANMFINSHGGDMSAGMQIISAMRESDGCVNTILDGTAFSMAAVIFLAGRTLSVTPCSRLMLHHGAWGSYGKGQEIAAQTNSTNSWIKEIYMKYCTPFITEDEVSRILRGEDMYFNTEDIKQRFPALGKTNSDGTSVMTHEWMDIIQHPYGLPVEEVVVEVEKEVEVQEISQQPAKITPKKKKAKL